MLIITLIFIYNYPEIAQIQNRKIYYKTFKRNIKKLDPNFLNQSIKSIRTKISTKKGLKEVLIEFLNNEAIWLDIQNKKLEEFYFLKYKKILYILLLGGYTSQFFQHKINWTRFKKSNMIKFNSELWSKMNKSFSSFSVLLEKKTDTILVELKGIHFKISLIDIYEFFLIFKINFKNIKISNPKKLYEKFKTFIQESFIPRIYFIPFAYENHFFERQVFRTMWNLKRKEYLIQLHTRNKIREIKEQIQKLDMENLFKNELKKTKKSIDLIKSLNNIYVDYFYNDWLIKLWKKYNIQMNQSYFF